MLKLHLLCYSLEDKTKDTILMKFQISERINQPMMFLGCHLLYRRGTFPRLCFGYNSLAVNPSVRCFSSSVSKQLQHTSNFNAMDVWNNMKQAGIIMIKQHMSFPTNRNTKNNLLENERQSIGKLTHVNIDGNAVMVGVGDKPNTKRTAKAQVKVLLGESTFLLVSENKIKKGDVLTVAQIAGITAAKQTDHLIPLCHSIQLTKVDVECRLDSANFAVLIETTAETTWKTGVEMEALVAASVAALTVYDMCKANTHNIVIQDLKLLKKSGGTKKDYIASH